MKQMQWSLNSRSTGPAPACLGWPSIHSRPSATGPMHSSIERSQAPGRLDPSATEAST